MQIQQAFMVTGTALGQAASIVLAPVLTRIYTPDQFGYLSVYTAALTIVGVIAVLGFELAIPIAATQVVLANLLAISGVTLIPAFPRCIGGRTPQFSQSRLSFSLPRVTRCGYVVDHITAIMWPSRLCGSQPSSAGGGLLMTDSLVGASC